MIRPAVATDVGTLQAIAEAAYRPYVTRIGRKPAPMTADYDRAVRDGQVWVDEERAAVVGFVVLVPYRDHLLLDNVAVGPVVRGTGVGARLLAFAEERACRLGLPEIRLCTNEAMTENLAYYPRRGYVETHRAEEAGFRRVYFRKSVPPRASGASGL